SAIARKLVGRDGRALPHDGASIGELKVRGNWVISGYFKGEGGEVVDEDGWLGTGDVGTIDADGYVRLTAGLKDVIKRAASGFPRSRSRTSPCRIPTCSRRSSQ